MSKKQRYFFNLAVAFDQLLNALFAGDPDTCVSSRLALNYPGSWMMKSVNYIFYILFNQRDHCQKSLANEEGYTFNCNTVIK